MRDLCVLKSSTPRCSTRVILLVLPIFSVDAHERREPRTNRINQNGPESDGLAHDAGRAQPEPRLPQVSETPEMRALIGNVFTQWWPPSP